MRLNLKTHSLLLAALLISPTAFALKEVNIALTTEPPQLNTAKATDTESNRIVGHILEGLTRQGKNGETLPGVATDWKINDKGATFSLRKNAKWSDGSPLRAQDFVFAWRLAVDPKTASEYAFILFPVKNAEAINSGKLAPTELGVKAKDDHTLEVVFEKPCGYFLGLTSFTTYMPIREEFYKTRGDRFGADAKDLLANGPFMLTSWVHGASLTLEKNKNYWNSANVKIDRINIPYITPDTQARFNFFKDGKIDYIDLDKDTLPLAQAQKYKMNKFVEGTVFFMEFNFREGHVTRNKALRQAIAMIFNRDEYIKNIVAIPGTIPGNALVPGWLPGAKGKFRQEYPYTPAKRNIAEARKLVEQAKKELGVSAIPPLVWLTGDTPLTGREAEYFQQQFKQHLGIELKIDRQIFKQRLAKMTSGEFDIVAAGWGPDYADPMTFVDLKTSWNENNRGKYADPQVDALVKKAQGTTNSKDRMDAMAAAERKVLEDVAILPTYERTWVYLTSPRLEGMQRHQIAMDPEFTWANVK